MTAGAAAVLRSVGSEAVVLEEVRAEASIDDLLAEVTVTQRYRNPRLMNIEAIYTFPLPAEGVLLGFEVEIGRRRLAGVVVAKADAERRYEDAITDGDAAVLLEQAGPGLFTASVGNLAPGETATIRFRYGLLLRWNGDRIRFAMPTTIAPRYGDPAAAGLAPELAPEYVLDAARAFSLRVAVRGLLKDARFNSPSHAVTVASDAQTTVIALAGTPAMDRDFVLEARLARRDATGALAVRDLDGWVALASFRPEIPTADDDRPRSVKIVVDCSGSMGGDSIAQARAALERILDGLRPGDLFEIVAFGSRHRALFGGEMPVSETTLAVARRFVRALDADMGGTEIGAALEAAYALGGDGDPLRDLLLITDGEVWDRASVVARARRSGHRHFTVGVGSAVAEALLRELAEATGGACELVAPREDMAERIHRHIQRLYAPRARSALVCWPARPVRTEPRSVRTVHGGDTVHVFAWFAEKPAGHATLEVELADGRVISQGTRITTIEEAPAGPAGDSTPCALARIGAARRIAAMADGEAAKELALRYQLVSAWTNCVVVHVRAGAGKATDLPLTVRVPQELAAGWHGMGTVQALVADLSPDLGFSPRRQRPARRGRPRERDVDFLRADPEQMRAPAAVRPRPDALREEFAVPLMPEGFVARLNGRAMPPFPALAELGGCGVPDAIVVGLHLLLVGRGLEEEAVVLAFLHLVAESEAGDRLGRAARRAILVAVKARRAQGLPIDAVAAVLKGCRGWEGLVPPRRGRTGSLFAGPWWRCGAGPAEPR